MHLPTFYMLFQFSKYKPDVEENVLKAVNFLFIESEIADNMNCAAKYANPYT